MTCQSIVEHPDPRLRETCEPVDRFDESVSTLVDDLFDTLYASTGIALCAPQTGTLQRVFVMDLSSDHSTPQEYINPEILSKAGLGWVEESCLSLPGIKGNVMRAVKVQVRAQDRLGQVFERELEGMHAVCVQHEIDHLNGILFIDRLSWVSKLRMRLRGRPR